MKRHLIALLSLVVVNIYSQDPRIPIDTMVVTTNSVVIKGKTVPYKATTGMQPVFNDNGKVTDFVELLFIPSFNLADTYISFGIVLLLYSEIKNK